MSKLGWRKSCCAIALLSIAGCAGEEQPQPTDARTVARARTPALGRAVPSASYVAEAASIDLFIIGSSELALRRSASQRVRDVATTMIAAHKGTSGQLSFAGRRLNLLPSATLDTRHQAMLDSLAQAPDFDAAYRRQQIAVHQEALALHTNYASYGSSPTLRPVAASIVPVIQRDIRLLQYL